MTGEELDADIARRLAAAAEAGVREAAIKRAMNLEDFDIIFSDFVYHPIDSTDAMYFGAAKSAFASALDAWGNFYPPGS